MKQKTRTMTVRLSNEIRASIELLATELGITQTAVVEMAVQKVSARQTKVPIETINGKWLSWGDSKQILRDYIEPESIDLIYFSLPFSIPYGEKPKTRGKARQLPSALDDQPIWNTAVALTYKRLTKSHTPISALLTSLYLLHGDSGLMSYIVTMSDWLIEFHRILKPTGSLYLDCNTKESHYSKILSDAVFGANHFRSEIVIKRPAVHREGQDTFRDLTERLLYYVKTNAARFNSQHAEQDANYIRKTYRYDDGDGRGVYRLGDLASPYLRSILKYPWEGFAAPENGWRFKEEAMRKLHDEGRIYYPRSPDGTYDLKRRPALKRYLSEQETPLLTNLWTDDPHRILTDTIAPESNTDALEFIERIILASSGEGDVVLDPLCGYGTTIIKAQQLNRNWIGIASSAFSVAVMSCQLKEMNSDEQIRIVGGPKTVEDAAKLAKDDDQEFRWWVLGLIGVPPVDWFPKSLMMMPPSIQADGAWTFFGGVSDPATCWVQVKTDSITHEDLNAIWMQLKQDIWILVTLREPEPDVKFAAELQTVNLFQSSGVRKVPQIQILTVEELLTGKRPQLPASASEYVRLRAIYDKVPAKSVGTDIPHPEPVPSYSATKYLSTDEVAKRLGVTRTTVRKWCASGELKCERGRRDWLIPESILNSFRRPTRGRPKEN